MKLFLNKRLLAHSDCFKRDNINNLKISWNYDPEVFYAIVMIDIDSKYFEYVYMMINIPGNDINKGYIVKNYDIKKLNKDDNPHRISVTIFKQQNEIHDFENFTSECIFISESTLILNPKNDHVYVQDTIDCAVDFSIFNKKNVKPNTKQKYQTFRRKNSNHKFQRSSFASNNNQDIIKTCDQNDEHFYLIIEDKTDKNQMFLKDNNLDTNTDASDTTDITDNSDIET